MSRLSMAAIESDHRAWQMDNEKSRRQLRMTIELRERLGEDEFEAWLDETFPGSTARRMTLDEIGEKYRAKLEELDA